MKTAILCFFLVVSLQATTLQLDTIIASQAAQTIATVILDANKGVLVCDFTFTSTCWYYTKDNLAAGDRTVFAMSLMNAATVNIRSASPTTCNDPCTIVARLNFGDASAIAEEATSGGANLSPRKISPALRIPMVSQAPIAAGSWKLPMEIIGGDNYHEPVQFAVPAGAPTTSCVLGMRVNNHSYTAATAGWGTGGLNSPYDGKISFRIWSSTATASAGSWINVNNTNSTTIDESQWYGIDGQHAIASVLGTIEVTTPIPDNSFSANSTAVFDPRFNGTDGITSGYRILDWWITCGSATQLTSISVTTNVATTSPSIGSTGDDWYPSRAPGVHGRFNGRRHLTAAGQFSPCGSGAGFYMLAGACASPNGTYAPPTSTANAALIAAFPGTAQPTMWAAKIVAPATSTLVYDDPSTYTAPAGGNAIAGHNYVITRGVLLNSNSPGNNYTLNAACSDCHAGNPGLTGGMSQELSDLYLFNYSNYAIEMRVLFHGGTWQNALDVAAYIRGINTVTAFVTSRAWNPLMQPGPGADASPQQFLFGCGVDCVPTYDADIPEYMQPAGSKALWAYNQLLPYRDIPNQITLHDWNHWLSAIHPVDSTSSTYFITDTSSTSVTVPTQAQLPASLTFTTANSDAYPTGSTVYLSYPPNEDINMGCRVVSDTGTTLVCSIFSAGGGGSTLASWHLNSPYSDYTSLITSIAANTSTAYKASASAISQFVSDLQSYATAMSGCGSDTWTTSNGGNTYHGSCVPPAIGATAKDATQHLGIVKVGFELMYPNLIGMLDSYYTQITGHSRPSSSYDNIGLPIGGSRLTFNIGNHITLLFPHNTSGGDAGMFPIPAFHAVYDIGVPCLSINCGSETTQFYLETHQWYILAGPVAGFGNYVQQASARSVHDTGYIGPFSMDVATMRPSINYNAFMLEVMYNQASADLTPGPGTGGGYPAGGSQWLLFTNLYTFLSALNGGPAWSFMTSAQQADLLTWLADALNTQSGLATVAQWNASADFNGYTQPGGDMDWEGVWNGGEPGAGANISALLTLGHYFGVSLTPLTTLATFADSLNFGSTGGGTYEFLNDLYANCYVGGSNNSSLRGNAWWPFCSNLWQGNDHYKWRNLSTLGAAIAATSGVGITFASGTNIPSMSSVQVDSESIGITVGTGGACSGASCTISSGNVVRGIFNTMGATHSNGAAVSN